MNKDLYDAGMKTRREVLGDAYVNAAMSNADEFGMPLQELVAQYCWGDVWNRRGLDRKTRSIITLSFLIALNRPHELRTHIRGAINNGLTKAEIRELFLHAAIYCGVPASVDSFRAAKEVFAEMKI
jgi:4-carboxymuconolactone decarboxylase